MKIITILGTRPEIIKLSPLLPLLDQEFNHLLIHTGQHYSWEMDTQFFEELQLREPDYNLNVGSGSHGEQTGKMIVELEKIFLQEQPTHVIIFGDTNSTLAGALAAVKIHPRTIHLEAGARSRNRQQPEEINRIIADHCADLLFTIDTESTENLLREGFKKEQIVQVGNIVEEACARIQHAGQDNSILKQWKVEEGRFILATIHRAENTDNPENLKNIIAAFNALSKEIPLLLLKHETNKGLGETMRDGLEYLAKVTASNDVIVTLDCDDTHEPKFFPLALKKLREGYDVVILSRFCEGGGEEGMSLVKSILSRGAGVFLQIFFPIKGVKEFSCGYRVIRAAILKTAIERYGANFIRLAHMGFVVTPEILIRFRMLGARITESPFTLRYDQKPTPSKNNSLRTIKGYFALVWNYWGR